MANLQRIQTDFTWGELSPSMLARVDAGQYSRATKTMLNAYPLVQGGCTRRPGTSYVAELYNSNQKARLIPFVYDTTESYLLILNGGKIEFVKNGEFVKVSGTSNNYQITCPYTESELAQLTFAQAGNSLFFAHPNHPPRQLQRLSENAWNLTTIAFTCQATSDYWYENYAISFKILSSSTKFEKNDKFTFSVTGGVVGVITASGDGTSGAMKGNGTIAQVSATGLAPNETWTVTCTYSEAGKQLWNVVGSVSGSLCATWRTGSYPAAVAFYDQRLWFGGSVDFPQTIWASKIGSHTNFTLGSADADALSFTIASNNFDGIRHLIGARQLLVLTYSGEFSMAGGTNGTITPSAVKIQPQTFHGTASVKPIRIAQEVIFIQRDTKKARAISYSVTEDANIAPDITMFADHVTGSGLVDMAFAQDPHFIAWAVRADGILTSLTLNRNQDGGTVAWARHTTDGKFENVVAFPNVSHDEVYFVVNRTINGVNKRYLEKLNYDSGAYSDCSTNYTVPDNGKATTFSGFNYLEGKTVDVVADGLVHPQVTVTDGNITLQYPANTIKVGLHYTTTIELLHPEFGSDASSSVQGRKLSVISVIARLQDTVNCTINGNQISFRRNTDGLDATIPPFTGDKEVSASGWKSPCNIKIEQITPMPFTVLGVILKAAIND